MELVKLIWDFRGPNSEKIALHHAKHLAEFINLESLEQSVSGNEKISEMHHIAFMVVPKTIMNTIRERLKPSRGQLFS